MHPVILLNTLSIEHDLRVRAASRRRILRRSRPARGTERTLPPTSPERAG